MGKKLSYLGKKLFVMPAMCKALTRFWPMFPFDTQGFSGVFRGYKMGTLVRNGSKAQLKLLCKELKLT